MAGKALEGRNSALLTIIKGSEPWAEKRAALIDFTYKPDDHNSGDDHYSGNWVGGEVPDSFAEVTLAQAHGLLTFDQVQEVRQGLAGKGSKPAAAAPEKEPEEAAPKSA